MRSALLSGALVLGPLVCLHCAARADGVFSDAGTADARPTFGTLHGDAATYESRRCASDLQSVVREDGSIVRRCAPEEGCAWAKCVSACDAAAAAKGAFGCDYQIAPPALSKAGTEACYAVVVANPWSTAAVLTVKRGAAKFDLGAFARMPKAGQPESAWDLVPEGGLPSGKVAVLFLSADASHPCPVPAALSEPSGLSGTEAGTSWEIASSAPVTAYELSPYGGGKSGGASASLLLPRTSWGTQAIATLPPSGNTEAHWATLGAAADDTHVQVVPTLALRRGGDGIWPGPSSDVVTYTLKRGQYIQIEEATDISGSLIVSDKPVSFVGGRYGGCFATETTHDIGCGPLHDRVPPVAALASDYAVVPHPTRRMDGVAESVLYRIVGSSFGTTLTYDPPIANAPQNLGPGEVADFASAVAFTVRSQDEKHPFYVAETMSRCSPSGAPGNSACLGGETFSAVVPPEQFLQKYVFFTDPSYRRTQLVFVRKKRAGKFYDVDLGCLGPLAGWRPLDAAGQYETTTVPLQEGFAEGSCKNGLQNATSDAPFGVTVWGLDAKGAYAYALGGNATARAGGYVSVVAPPVPK